MALTVYLDDSNPFLVLGGLAATVEQWDKFNEQLNELDIGFEAPPFHAKIFEKARHGYGFYSAWAEEKRNEYLNRFVGIITRRCFKAFATLLEKAVYDEIIRPQKAFKEFFYSPFVFAAVNCINAARQWRDEQYPGEPLLFIFDNGNKKSAN
jgi:hypothetical protein